MWIFSSVVWKICARIWKELRVNGPKHLCSGPKVEIIAGNEVMVASQIYQDTTLPQIQGDWFSFQDISMRLSVAGASFCYAMLSQPLPLLQFTFMYNKIFSSKKKALLSSLFLPFWPVLMVIYAIYHRNLAFLPMLNVQDENLESLQFFTNNLSPMTSFLYDFTQEFSNYIGNFFILGPCQDAIQTMYWDTDTTTKVFWREQLKKAGAKISRELGTWDGAQLEIKEDIMSYNCVVIKVTNSCMGVGDMFLKKNVDYSDTRDLEDIFKNKYQQQKCILLEFILAKEDLGVHSLDILTARDPQGNVQLFDVIVWAGSNSDSSHGATDCYMINPVTELACSTGGWYNPNFLGTSPSGLGTRYPDVGKAVNLAIQAHRNLPFPWLSVVGWDCMITRDSTIVFFEGNLAAWRCPRRLFLSWRNFLYFVNYVSWVSGV